MTTNSSVKLDAFGLVITALREHEKNLDRIVEQLTLLTNSLEKTNRRLNEEINSIKHEKTS
ncbi:MAG: hypothetical protein O2V44_08375 [Candidatus Bathyarchaeota archaeon]|nr:hypothetical protein [Candidatus Bathyarchaeota archaeon]